jgi:restriction system protein
MTQHHSQGVRGDGLIGFVDWVLRAFVVVVLAVGYLTWLGRSPIPALLLGCVVLVLVLLWQRVPWAIDANTGGLRAARIADVDLMTCREFQQLIARLMDRDSFVGVRATGIRDDDNTDVVGRTPTGHKVVVQCNRDSPRRRVGTPDVQRLLGTAHDEHRADIAVLVTTGRFTRSALALGERRDVVLLDRSQLAAWMTGRATPLSSYLV